MKKTLLLLLAFLPLMMLAENTPIIFNDPNHFHHLELYGERGECLFPMDENDFAVLTDIVECDKDIAQIMDAVNAWLARENFKYKLDVSNSDKYVSSRQLIFKAELPIGHKLLFDGGTPVIFTVVPLDWDVSESDVSFVCKIDIKDKKFRYTFNQIEADRWRIKGEAETSGPINDLHWQRVNCLKNKIGRTKSEDKIRELLYMIEYEKAIYQKEFDLMKQIESDLINCVKDEIDKEEFDF